jgi:hypothetical protein
LNGHAQGRGSLAQAEHARVYSRGREGGSDEFRRRRLAVQATGSAKGQGCSEERVKAITNSQISWTIRSSSMGGIDAP